MTPTPKHIEEARRFADHICLDTERDVVVQKLATLLAAQEELNQLRAERDELIKRIEAFNHYTQQDWRETVKEIVKLRTHNAALLAVARAMRTVHTACAMRSEPYIPPDVRGEIEIIMDNALSALEPLGIKV